MSLDYLLSTEKVQSALPNFGTTRYYSQFARYTKTTPLTFPTCQDDVKEKLMAVAICLDEHEKRANIWKRQYKKQDLSPLTHFINLISGVETRQSAKSPTSSSVWSASSILTLDFTKVPELGHEDFEHLYYIVLCKLHELYRDLQVRYASKFITLEHILHNRGNDGYSIAEPFDVLGMKYIIFSAWFLFNDERFISILDSAVKKRKSNLMTSQLMASGHGGGLSFRNRSNASSKKHDTQALEDLDIRKAIREICEIKNPFVILDIVFRKYHLGPYRAHDHDEVCIPKSVNDLAKVDTRLTSLKSEKLLPPNSHHTIQKHSVLYSCICKATCPCKLFCNRISDICVCVLRPGCLTDLIDKSTAVSRDDSLPSLNLNGFEAYSGMKDTVSVPSTPNLTDPNLTTAVSVRKQEEEPQETPPAHQIGFAGASPATQAHGRKHRHNHSEASNTQPKKISAIPKWPSDSDISYRIPFETNRYFKSSGTRTLRYVSAGGSLPLSERPQVAFDLVPKNHNAFSTSKEELLGLLPSIMEYKKHVIFANKVSAPKSRFHREKKSKIRTEPHRLFRGRFGDVIGSF